MNARHHIALAAFATAATLAACGGGSQGSFTPAAPSPAKTQTPQNATATFKIAIPSTTQIAGRKYVSPSTKSIALTIGGVSLAKFDTTPTSQYCSASNGSTLCSFPVALPLGNDTIAVTAYDGAGQTGSIVSTGNVTQAITAGNNTIAVTMSGVVTSVSIALATNGTLNAGKPANIPVTVMAKDADGNVIVGPGAYSSPIAISNSDTSGVTTLQVNGKAATSTTSPSDLVTLVYNGGNLTQTTITVGSTGCTPCTLVFRPIPTEVALFPMPQATANDTIEPGVITSGADGNLWVSYQGYVTATGTWTAGVAKMTTSGVYTVYTPSPGGLQNGYVSAIAKAPAASGAAAYFLSGAYISKIATDGTVTNYPQNCGGQPGNFGLVSDGSSGFWFTATSYNSAIGNWVGAIGHVDAAGNVACSSPLQVSWVNGLVLGKDGNLYVATSDANTNAPAVLQFVSPAVSGTTVTGTANELITDTTDTNYGWYNIVQSADGDLWLSNDQCTPSLVARLHIASPFNSSTVTTFPTANGCAYPAGLAALADGSVWVANDDWATVQQILPQGTNPPYTYTLNLPNSNYVYPDMWAATVGPDGDLYFTDYNYGCHWNGTGNTCQAGEVMKVSY